MEQLDLIVIGAGISGVAIAARAAAAGLSVAVVEQHATVAQGASFAHSGMVFPSPLDPWFGPAPVTPDVGGLPWGRTARQSAADAAQLAQFAQWEVLTALSRTALSASAALHGFEYEARDGALYLFRTELALARAKGLSDTLTEAGIAHRFLDPEACRTIEPALAHTPDIAGALMLDQLQSGNCALAAKRLKASLAAQGVDFLLARRALGIRIDPDRVCVDVKPATQAAGAFVGVQAQGFVAPSLDRVLNTAPNNQDAVQRLFAKRVVLAAGNGTADLLSSAGLMLPQQSIGSQSLTGAIAHETFAPHRTLIDAERGVALVRFEQRLRASTALAAKPGKPLPPKSLDRLPQILHESAEDRVPGAARLHTDPVAAEQACGADGLPIIGACDGRARTNAPTDNRLYLSLSGAYRGWGLAFGAADILIRQITGAALEDSWQAFSPQRFG